MVVGVDEAGVGQQTAAQLNLHGALACRLAHLAARGRGEDPPSRDRHGFGLRLGRARGADERLPQAPPWPLCGERLRRPDPRSRRPRRRRVAEDPCGHLPAGSSAMHGRDEPRCQQQMASLDFRITISAVEIHPSARKHGIADEDIEHAVENAMSIDERDDDTILYLGPARHADLLEVVTIAREDGSQLVIHAMRMRPRYSGLLQGG
jgi:hypothetical protein